jgi:ribosomal protein S18 acetylase RimI-like enzyme
LFTTKSIYDSHFIEDAMSLTEIREFRKEDFDDIIECSKVSFAEEFEIGGFDPEVWRKAANWRFSILGETLFSFLRLLDKEPMKLFVAEVNGRVVGTTMVTKRGNSGYISLVMVHSDFRRKGIATELVKTAIDYTRKRKLTRVILHVISTNNPAKSLYKKLGFEKFDDFYYLTVETDSFQIPEGATKIEVRDLQKSDLDQAYELIKTLRDPNWLKVYDFSKKDLKTPWLSRIFPMATMKKIVAAQNERIVGYASSSYTSAKEAGRITNVDVSPELVSQGVVEELIRISLNFVKSSGTKTVLVTVPLKKEELVKKLRALGFEKRLTMEGMVLELVRKDQL